jgi:probable rRNA maturation factor
MSQFDIDIQTEIDIDPSLKLVGQRAAEATLGHQAVNSPKSLTILFAGNTRLQQLNREFLGFDEPTDVLSFPAGDDWAGTESYIGDIAISLPTAESQAENAGHGLDFEVSLLVVHGVLHLLGYDHFTKADERRMWSVQSEILNRLKFESPSSSPS